MRNNYYDYYNGYSTNHVLQYSWMNSMSLGFGARFGFVSQITLAESFLLFSCPNFSASVLVDVMFISSSLSFDRNSSDDWGRQRSLISRIHSSDHEFSVAVAVPAFGGFAAGFAVGFQKG